MTPNGQIEDRARMAKPKEKKQKKRVTGNRNLWKPKKKKNMWPIRYLFHRSGFWWKVLGNYTH